MKRTISLLLLLVLALNLCACGVSEEEKRKASFLECVTQSDELIATFQSDYLDGKTPYTITSTADTETLTYTVTIAILPSEKLDSWIHQVMDASIAKAGLNSGQAEAARIIYRNQVDNSQAAAKFLGLAYLTLPLQSYEEIGVTLILQYQDRHGLIAVLDENALIASLE